MKPSSPASTGPAGAHFEGQVGAHYLLSMLVDSEPRGLPGTAIDRIEFQRGAEGHPLDDIVVHAHDDQGSGAVLEIQVKRETSFAPSDRRFRDVVAQIAEAFRQPLFLTTRHELSVAVARTSHRIEGPYQQVLTWARVLGCARTFMDRIQRPGSANELMREFIKTFKNNLRTAQAEDDDETVWRLLSRFHILPFDYTVSGSTAEALDKERAVRALHSVEVPRAGDFRRFLVETAIETAANGGDLTRERLIERVRNGTFRLAVHRRYHEARRVLTEASRHALDDIGDQVRGVTLTRVESANAVRAALDQGRYVEIRGDAGVGKSALLKHVAEGLSKEAPIIVLRPDRTSPGGWTRMRSDLGFDGTAQDLLVHLAGSGSTTIFLDGLDFFSQEERLTVRDLVREAAKVPGVSVIATARREFGNSDEPNWLTVEPLETLGRADAVIVGELTETEVDELRNADPELSPLLAESHPARAVARNLFRLSRLTEHVDAESPRTEMDMAEQWWRIADGTIDGRRDRSRLLQNLAEQAVSGTEPSNARGHPSRAVDTLVQSETLADLGGDRVAFRHDIYRDWAIANMLYSQPQLRTRLALERTAPAALIRGVELAARLSLERADDDSGWRVLLDEVSHRGTHGSWRRAVLLAAVRSEIAVELLKRISVLLLADGARLLCELIRTVIAVDTIPAREFAAPGVDPATFPENLHFPGGPSWWRLIRWLLTVGENLPSSAIPEVADLYAGWCVLGEDQITPKLVPWLHRWLTEIESAGLPEHYQERSRPFGGVLSNEQERLLETNLRSAFLLCCHHTPSLATEYLRSLHGRRHGDSLVGIVLKSPGSLSRAAPEELAEFTMAALIPDPARHESGTVARRNAFEYGNHPFMLPSPELGPFGDLLRHAPPIGLNLIRRMVDHAVSFYSSGRSDSPDTLSIPFSDCDRTFPWRKSYGWARAFRGPDTVVTTALMALTKWGHRRIADGDSVDAVLADMLGSSSAPAAYLLVAVDLLVAHWPLSRQAAVPFLACPELLCLDRDLALSERHSGGTAETSAARAVRHCSLYDLLPQYALTPPIEQRERLASLLRAAAERLGPYGECSHLGDPDFMVFHALNAIDPTNWKLADRADGTQITEYVVPDEEERHLARLNQQFQEQHADVELQTVIKLAVDDSTKSSPELAVAATAWAGRQAVPAQDHWVVVAAAALAMRDGDDALRERSHAWAREVFSNAFQSPPGPFGTHTGLWFNPVAIAFTGWVHLPKRSNARQDRRAILELTARDDCAAIPGFRAVAAVIAAPDERLPRAILRTAFAACIRVRHRGRESAQHSADRSETDRRRVRSAIDAELSWLDGTGDEPTWPTFPLRQFRMRPAYLPLDPQFEAKHDSCPAPPPRAQANLHAATRWLDGVSDLFDVATRPWLITVAKAYGQWTTEANGAELSDIRGHDPELLDWNDAYFKVVAHCLPGMEQPESDAFAIDLITSLPDEPFVRAADGFLRHVDKLYFGSHRLSEQQAVHTRSRLVDRVLRSRSWRHCNVGSMFVENNLGRAIAALFLADGYIRPPRCLLRPEGVDRMEPLLPVLQPIAVRFTAFHVVLSLFEVETRPDHLEFIIVAAEAWLRTHPDSSMFWVDYEAGRRVCSLIDAIRQQHPPSLRQGSALRNRVDYVLSALVSAGVTEAAHLEDVLSSDEA